MQRAAILTTMPDFGNFRDNEVAYLRAIYAIDQGDEEFGQQILIALRNHIRACREVKSVVHLLPDIEESLRCLAGASCTTTSSTKS